MPPDEADAERAHLTRGAMVAFAQDVMATQLNGLRREETGYNSYAFDLACDGFLVGALMTVAEAMPLPTPPREVAFIGLMAYLTEIKGISFESAQERSSMLSNMPEGSKAALLFEMGQRWRNPDALRIYFRTVPPGEGTSQIWSDAMARRKKYVLAIAGLILFAGAVALFVLFIK